MAKTVHGHLWLQLCAHMAFRWRARRVRLCRTSFRADLAAAFRQQATRHRESSSRWYLSMFHQRLMQAAYLGQAHALRARRRCRILSLRLTAFRTRTMLAPFCARLCFSPLTACFFRLQAARHSMALFHARQQVRSSCSPLQARCELPRHSLRRSAPTGAQAGLSSAPTPAAASKRRRSHADETRCSFLAAKARVCGRACAPPARPLSPFPPPAAAALSIRSTCPTQRRCCCGSYGPLASRAAAVAARIPVAEPVARVARYGGSVSNVVGNRCAALA